MAGAVSAANGRSTDASAVWKLLDLLSIMQDWPALRQSTLIVLAVHAELVPRLWFAYLKVHTVLQDGWHTPRRVHWLERSQSASHGLQGCPRNLTGLACVFAGHACSVCMAAFEG